MANFIDELVTFANAHPVETIATLACVLLGLLLAVLTKKPGKPKQFLEPTEFKTLPLSSKKWITHNTLRLKFDLPHPSMRLGLPIGQHITFLAKDAEGKDVYRAYTPVSDDDQLGSVEFVIKIYPQGKMSQVLNKLEVGQTMLMKGPKGRLQYKPNMKKHIGMLAGGTGITPMFQVINAILKNPADKTKVTLLFGNLSADDMLLREELDGLAAQRPGQLKVYHVLNNPPEGWTQGSGFITADLIKEHLPAPSDDVLVLRCGPNPMMEAMKKALEGLGYAEDAQFQF